MKYANPVIPGFYPDPSVCRVNGDFYLVTSSFEYFPGVPIFHSRNLVDWRQLGHCLTRRSQLPLSGAGISTGIYAPTIRHHAGRFYMVTTNVSNGGHFYVWSDDPAGDWSEPVWLAEKGIDPDLFWDDDGRVVFSCAGGADGIIQREVNLECGEFQSETLHTWKGCGGKCPEAPHVYRIDGRYYLMIAEGGTEVGHCVTVARGPGPLGPWESCPHNPILTHRSTNLPIQATGHADMVQDPNGNWWMVCLGIRTKGYQPCHILGRETFLAPVTWEDAWPVVGCGGRIALEMEGHDGLPPVGTAPGSTRDVFDGKPLPLHWNVLCNPMDKAWSQADGRLVLRCGEAGLGTIEGQSWVGRRQQHFDFRASARLEFTPLNEHEEAGLVVFQNVAHHYEVAFARRDRECRLIVRRTIGTLTAEVAAVPVPEGPLTLVIEGDETEYRFGYRADGMPPVFVAKGETRYLSTEVGGRFTGVYLAMYATANGQASGNVAAFEWFEYEALG